MSQITLNLIDIVGNRYSIRVNRDIPVEDLFDRVAQMIRRPIAGLAHRGHRLDASRRLSDLLYVDPSHPFLIVSYYATPNRSSIVNMPGWAQEARRERLETHLENLQSPVPRGQERRRRSNIMRAIQNAPLTGNLPNNLQRNLATYLGGKRTRKAKGKRKTTRKSGRR